MRTATSPSVSPKKKKGRVESQSAIRTAINQVNPQGLMKFFKQNTREEYNEQVRRHTAEEDERARDCQETNDAVDRCRSEKAKEGARDRQQKHRQAIYDSEIRNGERSPGGTKQRKRKVSTAVYAIELATKVSYH
jgi:hypothetical protein